MKHLFEKTLAMIYDEITPKGMSVSRSILILTLKRTHLHKVSHPRFVHCDALNSTDE